MNTVKNREIQLLELNLLKKVIEICEKYNLIYYIIGGSLIGVLRHKGFIPWDDDIDIGMPRKDYEIFLQVCNKEFSAEYGILNQEYDPTWNFNFVQVIDFRTKIEIHMTEIPRTCNLWVDLFPIDGLPSNKIKREIHFKHILYYRYLIQMANIKTQVDTHKVGRPLYEKIILYFLKILNLKGIIDVEKSLKKMNKLLKKYDFDTSEYAGNLLGKYREKEIVPKDYFGQPTQLPFEDILVNVPAKYHELQINLYGNYMQMPSEEYRVSHDIVFITRRD